MLTTRLTCTGLQIINRSRIIRKMPIRAMQMSSYSLIKTEETNGLRRIILNDKKTFNSLSMNMMNEIIEELCRNSSDEELRCITIEAEKGPVYCSGHNLKEMTYDKGINYQREIFAKCTELMLSIRKSEVPVISCVNGYAAAAGCQLVAACDFAIASDHSKFSTPGANFGLFCNTPGISVSRTINHNIASYMVLTGLPIDAEEALRAGLIVKVVPEEKLDSTINEIYSSIKNKSRSVIKLGKQFFYKQIEMKYEEALREGEKIMVQNLQYIDGQEGLQSFKEKRKPVWTHQDNLVQV